jgi:hypothetical protein
MLKTLIKKTTTTNQVLLRAVRGTPVQDNSFSQYQRMMFATTNTEEEGAKTEPAAENQQQKPPQPSLFKKPQQK